MKTKILFFLLFLPYALQAQTIIGRVVEKEQHKSLIEGATVFWLNTNMNTLTNNRGEFQIPVTSKSTKLVVSMVGYRPDTVEISGGGPVLFQLSKVTTLRTAEVTHERSGTMISMNPIKTEMITTKELAKAACCNLGESFETNATVDVTYKDAITGSKELQVLGLSGAYIQMLTENAPLISGLGLTYGLNGIPGTQIESINIVKGPGSIIFGPEAISGMINVDLKDPSKTDKLFVNGYIDENLRKELNIDKGFKLNDNLSSLLSVHLDDFRYKVDENNDTFLDMPMITNFNVLNKWKYTNGKGLMSQNSVKYLFEERMSGQTTFDYSRPNADLSAWGQKLRTNRFEFYGRTGYVIPSATYNSIGIQYSFVNHDQNGFYGLRKYDGKQQLANFRLIYNREINSKNAVNIGLSLREERIVEQYDTLNFDRNESTPGFFMEDTYKPNGRLTLIFGARADRFPDKVYYTPRANAKYAITDQTDLRISAGYGVRSPHLLSEYPALLVSSKEFVLMEKLEPEQALNMGVNLTHEFTIAYRKGTIGFDLYRTSFMNKVRADVDTDPLKVLIYNQRNSTYSNSFQVDAMYKILKPLELKLAYKYLDVYHDLGSTRLSEPYIANHRVLGSLYFESFNRRWKSNFTTNWVGRKRLPALHSHFSAGENKLRSPSYFVFNFQLTRVFNRWEWYAGAENIFDYKQMDHLIGSDDPYGPYFDASYVWGPMDGRRVYMGFRFKLNN